MIFRKRPSAEAHEPPYYEVWGSLESANRALWAALWASCSGMLLAFVLLRVSMSRPPVVIRVDSAGNAAASALSAQPAVSRAEVENFLKLFERFYTALNVYTYDDDLKVAFSMMTASYQGKANDALKRAGAIEALKADQGKTALTITEISVTRETPSLLECAVKGYREKGSYKPDGAASEVVFEDDVILRKVERSRQAPYGLLVEDFNESVFKR